eukprot:1160581-Pelagomonas_calceolata.AAC.6
MGFGYGLDYEDGLALSIQAAHCAPPSHLAPSCTSIVSHDMPCKAVMDVSIACHHDNFTSIVSHDMSFKAAISMACHHDTFSGRGR